MCVKAFLVPVINNEYYGCIWDFIYADNDIFYLGFLFGEGFSCFI